MAVNEPIDPRVRLAISQWPDDAPRGAVSTLCAEHGISRKSFYELRKRAVSEGQAAVLEPRTRRPQTNPTRLTEEVKQQAIGVRAALEASGLDHGPISVHDKMLSMGMPVVPSTASLSRIFRQAGEARPEPRKKPRSAWRRFVYPAPNACWRLDATEYVLTGGHKCVIFQLEDDHSRYAVASHVAWSETVKDAIAVFDKAVAAHAELSPMPCDITLLSPEPPAHSTESGRPEGSRVIADAVLARHLPLQVVVGSTCVPRLRWETVHRATTRTSKLTWRALAHVDGSKRARLGHHHAPAGRRGRTMEQQPVGDGADPHELVIRTGQHPWCRVVLVVLEEVAGDRLGRGAEHGNTVVVAPAARST